VRLINLEKEKKKELIRQAKEEKKSLKHQKKENKKEYRKHEKVYIEEEKEERRNAPLTEKDLEIRRKNEAPKRSVLEEIGNSVSHGLGAIFGIVALVLMLLKSDTPMKVTGSLVYGISMIIMMLMSCLYHAWKHGLRVIRLWRRLFHDYSSIYLLIGGTFAPLQLVELGINQGQPLWAWIWFSIMWALIITGITFVSIFGPGRTKGINFPLYFIIGWSAGMYIPGWWQYNQALLWWILVGGLVHSLGMIPFVLKKVPAAHFIFHLFVAAGAITQFIGFYTRVYMR
jgi:hemolysin III